MGAASTGAMGGTASGAATGALLGSAVPGLGTAMGAVGGAVLGGLGGLTSGKGADKAAAAAQAAAQERMRFARENYANVKGIINPAAARSLSEFDKAIATQDKNLARQEQMIAQIDPTIIEASQQALKLLRGESSSTLRPAQEQRNMQRQKLVNSLREQLGPGAETSTAGIQALTRFDTESNSLMSNQQQAAIQNLGNTFGQFSSYRPNMANEATTFGNLATGRYGIAANQAGTLNQAFAPVMGAAGANQVGQLMQGQYQQQMGNQLLQAGTQAGVAAITAKLGAKS